MLTNTWNSQRTSYLDPEDRRCNTQTWGANTRMWTGPPAWRFSTTSYVVPAQVGGASVFEPTKAFAGVIVRPCDRIRIFLEQINGPNNAAPMPDLQLGLVLGDEYLFDPVFLGTFGIPSGGWSGPLVQVSDLVSTFFGVFLQTRDNAAPVVPAVPLQISLRCLVDIGGSAPLTPDPPVPFSYNNVGPINPGVRVALGPTFKSSP